MTSAQHSKLSMEMMGWGSWRALSCLVLKGKWQKLVTGSVPSGGGGRHSGLCSSLLEVNSGLLCDGSGPLYKILRVNEFAFAQCSTGKCICFMPPSLETLDEVRPASHFFVSVTYNTSQIQKLSHLITSGQYTQGQTIPLSPLLLHGRLYYIVKRNHLLPANHLSAARNTLASPASWFSFWRDLIAAII